MAPGNKEVVDGTKDAAILMLSSLTFQMAVQGEISDIEPLRTNFSATVTVVDNIESIEIKGVDALTTPTSTKAVEDLVESYTITVILDVLFRCDELLE